MAKLVDQYWRDTIQETDEFEDAFWSRCQDTPSKTVNLRGEKWKVRTLYNESESGASFDGPAVATGSASQFQNLYVPYRTISTTGLISQEALDNDDGKSMYHPLVEEMNSTKLLAFKKLQRHCLMGDGTGRIAVTTDVETGSTVTCAPGTSFGNKGVQFVKPGKVVQIYDATGATKRTGGGADKLTVSTSTLPNRSTGVITFTTAAPTDVVATDIIVPEGMAARGVNGLPYWVANSGSLFELSRATYPGLSSTMVDGSSGALLVLVESTFARMAHYIEESVALGLKGEGKHEIFWSPTQREKYRKECLGLGITMLGTGKLDAGYGHKEEINGYDCTTIKDHDNTKIHFLKMAEWYRVGNNAASPFTPYNEPGSGANLYNVRDTATGGITTSLAFTLRGYVNLACKNVRNQAAIYSLPTDGLETGNI
jgi:hypothetical protein